MTQSAVPSPDVGGPVQGPPVLRAGAAATTGEGTATELRGERDKVQKQLDDLQTRIQTRQQTDPEAGATNSENTLIATLNTRIATLTQQITTHEERAPSVVAGGSPADKYIIRQNPDGTITTELNGNWDHKSEKPQTVTVGNRIMNVAPDGTVTVAYTDTDARELANRQTAVSEANAKTAALAQETTDFAARAKVDLETRVSNGEDAASVRAQQAQDLAELHQKWVEADGDARRQQEDLRDYNTNRHATATEQLTQEQLDQTRAYQAQQDATLQRGQNMQQEQAAAGVRERLASGRLSSGASYLGNTMDMLSRMNAAVEPGSSAVGNMLVPLMNLGQSFFSQLGGLPSSEDVLGGAGSPPPPAVAATTTPPGTLPTERAAAAAGIVPPASAAPPAALPTDTGTPDWYTQLQARQAQSAAEQAAAAATVQSGIPEGSSRGLPAYAAGGVVTRPTVALVGEKGPEAIVPLKQQGGTIPIQAFLQKLMPLIALANAHAHVAAQGAAALGHPPEVAANPMIPGTAVPGIPPPAARAAAQARPLAPDGSPYATPQDVQAALAARRGAQPPAAAPVGP